MSALDGRMHSRDGWRRVRYVEDGREGAEPPESLVRRGWLAPETLLREVPAGELVWLRDGGIYVRVEVLP